MAASELVFAQLMDLVPRHEFNACVKRYRGDHRLLLTTVENGGTGRSKMVTRVVSISPDAVGVSRLVRFARQSARRRRRLASSRR